MRHLKYHGSERTPFRSPTTGVTGSPPLKLFGPEFLDWRAGAKQISIAVNVVDARDARPEFVVTQPGRGEGGLLARIRVIPLFGSDLSRRVGRVF